MNIKTRLSLQYSLVVTLVLLFFSFFVYYFSYTSQLKRFRESLLESAKNTAILLIDVKEVDSTLLKKIHSSTIKLDAEEVVLTDTAFYPVYSNNVQHLQPDLIRDHYASGDIEFFSYREKDGVLYKHRFQGKTFYVYVMAADPARRENLSELMEILAWSSVISILLSILLSYLFSKNAIRPISKINRRIRQITSSRLNTQLEEGSNNDEIAQLAHSFNEMLAKLNKTFKNQEDFISNASHELRTPLTVMIAETDYLLGGERRNEEYRDQLKRLKEDLQNLNDQLSGLLELAQLNSHQQVQLAPLRLDEVIFSAINLVKLNYPERRIIPQIQYEEAGGELLIAGNAGLLEMAFKNLLENACKFSSDDVSLSLKCYNNTYRVSIADRGIGIPAADHGTIYNTFSRGSNVRQKEGFGVGLSLVIKILEVHQAEISLQSAEGQGTRFIISFTRWNAGAGKENQ